MDKKKTIISLVLLTIIGSLVVFYANNLLMSIICNGAVISSIALAAIPFFVFALDVVALTIFVIRLYKNKEYKKALIKHYSLLILIFSIIGVVFSCIVGTVVYDSFVEGPFKAYSAITVSANLLFAAVAGVVRFFLLPKMEDDKEVQAKKGAKYVFYTIVLSFAIYYAFNKAGAVLFTPIYAQARTLYMTWVFYLALLTPLAILVVDALYALDVFKTKKALMITIISVLAIVLVLNVAVMIVGFGNSKFIAAVSFAVPLERLGSKPFDALFRPLLAIGFGIELLIKSLKK